MSEIKEVIEDELIKEEEIKVYDNDDDDDNDIFKNRKDTYSLSIITTWLKEKNIPFTYCNGGGVGFMFYNHGLRISIKNDTLSVQTHPNITGWAFAETLLLSNMRDETRHKTPEDLFTYIKSLL